MNEQEKYLKCVEDIGKLVQKTSRVFQLMEREQVIRDQYTTSQVSFMLELLAAPAQQLPMAEVIERMKLEKSSVTRLADNLIKYGLVIRSKDRLDKRLVFFTLTDKGIEITRELKEKRLNYYKSIITKLPKGHVREVMHSFEILLDALEKGLE